MEVPLWTLFAVGLLFVSTVSTRDLHVSLNRTSTNSDSGRVLLHYYDKTFSLSQENWDKHIARIVCKSLSLPSSGAEAISFEAAGKFTLWDKSFFCSGKETHISECIQEEINVKDYRGGDAGVICKHKHQHKNHRGHHEHQKHAGEKLGDRENMAALPYSVMPGRQVSHGTSGEVHDQSQVLAVGATGDNSGSFVSTSTVLLAFSLLLRYTCTLFFH